MVKKFAIKQPKPQATTMYFWAIATTTSFRLYSLNTTLATSISTARSNTFLSSILVSVQKWFEVIREKVCTFALSNSINNK